MKRLDSLASTVAEVFGSPEAAVRKVLQVSTWHQRYRTAGTLPVAVGFPLARPLMWLHNSSGRTVPE